MEMLIKKNFQFKQKSKIKLISKLEKSFNIQIIYNIFKNKIN